MPPLSQWYVRAGLVHLLLGFTLGALLLANKGVPLHPALWAWLPAHIELLLMGWIVQLTLGVAFWIAPRFMQAPRRGDVRGAYAAFALLNGGVWLVVLSSPLRLAVLLLVGRLLEVGAAVAFAHTLWPRIVSRDGAP